MWWLLFAVLPWPAFAQPADCAAVPVGVPIDLSVYLDLPGTTAPAQRDGGQSTRARVSATAGRPDASSRQARPSSATTSAMLGLHALAANGTVCSAPKLLPGDVLRGPPIRGDILGGDGPRDLLRRLPQPEVIIGPAAPWLPPSAAEPPRP